MEAPVAALSLPVSTSPHWSTAVLLAGLGIALLLRQHASPVLRSYLLQALAAAACLTGYVVVYGSDDPARVAALAPWLFVLVTLAGPALYQFAALAGDPPRRTPLHLSLIWAVALGMGALQLATPLFVDGLLEYPWGYYPRYTGLMGSWLAFQLLLALAALRLLWRGARAPAAGAQQQERCRLLFMGTLLGSVSFVDLLPGFGVFFAPVGPVLIPAFFAIVSYVTWRYRLVLITPRIAASKVLERMSEALLVVDSDGVVRLANPAAERLFGARVHSRQLLHALDDPALAVQVRQYLAAGDAGIAELRYCRSDGSQRTLGLSYSPFRSGRGGGYILVFNDMSALKAALQERERALRKFQAALGDFKDAARRLHGNTRRDSLTGLYNRLHLEETLPEIWHCAAREDAELSVLMLELSNHASICRQHGSDRAERVLRQIALVLREVAGEPGDLLARWGDTRFVLVLVGRDGAGAARAAEQARHLVGQLRFSHEQAPVEPQVSVGVAVARPTQLRMASVHSLLRLVDASRQRAVETGITYCARLDDPPPPAEPEAVSSSAPAEVA